MSTVHESCRADTLRQSKLHLLCCSIWKTAKKSEILLPGGARIRTWQSALIGQLPGQRGLTMRPLGAVSSLLHAVPRRTRRPPRSTAYSNQTWNWVIGSPGQSMGHLGHFSRPGHRVIILTRCETRVFFPVFDKMPKMQNVHRKCCNDKSHCQVSFVGLKSLEVSPCNELLLLPMIIKHSLA